MSTYADPALILPGVVGEIELDPQIIGKFGGMFSNIALNAFRIAVNGSLVRFQLQDGVIDDFQDDSGLDVGTVSSGKVIPATYELYNSAASHDVVGTTFGVAKTYVATEAGTLNLSWGAKTNNGSGSYSSYSRIFVNGVGVGTQHTSDSTSYSYFNETITVLEGDVVELQHKNEHSVYTSTVGDFVIGSPQIHIDSVSVEAESQPTNVHVVLLVDDVAISLNEDLLLYITVDDGTTWEPVSLEVSGNYSTTEKIVIGSTVVTGVGTTIKYKIECTDEDFEFYAVGLLWD